MFSFFKVLKKASWAGNAVTWSFVQGRHPLVREEPLLFCTLVGFQVLAITKARGKIIGDIDKHQLLCLDTHEIVIPFHGNT